MAKTAVQKRDGAPPPHVEVLAEAKGPQYPAGRMLVASPLEVLDVVSRVPAGRVLRLGDLRATLAIKFRADYTCAMTTGIFLRIIAEAAHEERGKAGPMPPYWRVVRDDGELIDKLPGGVEAHAAKLEADGVDVFRFGARRVVGNVEHYAWVPPPPKRRGKPPAPGPAPAVHGADRGAGARFNKPRGGAAAGASTGARPGGQTDPTAKRSARPGAPRSSEHGPSRAPARGPRQR